MDRFVLKTPRSKSCKSKQPRSDEDISIEINQSEKSSFQENSSILDSGYG